jgi:hypothetical protein
MDHENSHILKKAIDEMPAYVAPARVWAGIQSEIVPEQNRTSLEEALREYKGPVASPVSWEKLASRIADKQSPRQNTGSSEIRIFSVSNAGYWLSGIAAAVIIGVCIGVYISTRYEGQGMRYEAMAPLHEATEEEALRFIDRFCKGENIVCTSAAFLELKAELDESTEELKEISKQLSVFQNDPGLLQAKSTIEKYRATVLKEITLMI